MSSTITTSSAMRDEKTWLLMRRRPVVEINFMGYADPAQIGTGLRQRLYSRAFVIGNPSKPSDRFVYLVLDTAMGDTAVRYGILNGLKALGGEYAQYGQSNVAVTGTHSHSGPAGWMNYLIPQVTSKGFDKQSYRAIVDGAIKSIQRAHESVQTGHLSFGTTKVTGGSINRSLYAYLANPAAERAKYASGSDDGSVERDLTLLKFENTAGKALGVLTWFPVHGTSMLGNNTLVTGDNKGVASYLFEQSMGGGFVAGFSQANVGDTTPNVLGAWCEDGSNQQCSFDKSVCADGKSQSCHGRGPFFQVKDNGASSCFEIGKRQSDAALGLYNNWASSKTDVTGGAVKSFHQFHDMSKYSFRLPNGTQVKTCPAALGYSFAGGTTDGPGAFDFTQGDSGAPDANPLWRVVSGLLKGPGPEQKACHAPKPILLNVGEISEPYDWTPNIVDIQVLRVGQFVIIVAPGEASTMQGRRWKDAVAASITSQGIASNPKVVIGGPANTYGHYIVTQEEYTRQRYEGASTLYGQWTAHAYIMKTLENIKFLKSDSTTGPDPGPSPPDNSDNSLSFITGVVYDGKPLAKPWGGIITNVQSSYTAGSVVGATFIGANPRNNLRLEGTFAAVEKDVGGTWARIRDDKDWELVYNWKRTNGLTGTSDVTITWESKSSDRGGRYRLKYYGDWKNGIGGKISPFEGTSGVFTLT